MDSVYKLSLTISSVIILLVFAVSILIMILFMARNMEASARATADEIAAVLALPLYNVDDDQCLRIMETLVSTGRISGAYLESTASGTLMDSRPSRASPWLRPQVREPRYRDYDLGRLEIHYSDAILGEVVGGVFFIMTAVIGAVIVANVLATRSLIRNRAGIVFGAVVAGIDVIAKGNYSYALPYSGYGDVDSIVRGVNEMSSKISAKNEELTEANQKLEERVASRTRELETALREQALLQERLVESGRLTALGQLSAGIAHELNTPLGAISSSAQSLTDFFDGTLRDYLGFASSLPGPERRLFDAALELGMRESRELGAPPSGLRTIRAVEAALKAAGREANEDMATTIADLGLASRLDRLLPLLGGARDGEVLRMAGEAVLARRMVEVIIESARKGASVISALRSYLSPQAEEEGRVVDVAADIARVLTLMHNMLKHGVVVRARLSPVKVLGSSDKLSQVWMNIIRNAAQAMEFSGELEIVAEEAGGQARISFIDSGPGIPEAIAGRVFEPFFTTKKHGDGMGLGLDICRKIVETYKGAITFESRPGRTAFTVVLPALANDEAAQGARDGEAIR